MAEVTSMRNNALPYPIYAQAYVVTFPLLDADGDPISPSSPDSEVSKNGDTFTDCTNEATEIATSSGSCYLILTASEMTADIVTVQIKSTGAKTTVLTLYPRKLVVLATGTCQGSNDTGDIQLASGDSAIDDYYNGCLVVAVIDSTTEARIINDYVGSTKVAEVSPAWNTAQPDSNDTYTIYLPEGRQIQGADVKGLLGTAWLTPGTAGTPDVNVKLISDDATAANNAESFFDGTGYAGTNNVIPTVTTLTNLPAITANWLTAAGIASDAFTAAKFAADVTTEFQSGLSTLTQAQVTGGAYALNSASFAFNAALDFTTTQKAATLARVTLTDTVTTYTGNTPQTGDSFYYVPTIYNSVVAAVGAVADASATTTVFKTNLADASNFWNDCLITFTSGALAGQTKPIASYSATNGTVTLDEALTSAPANGVAFNIIRTHVHPVTQIAAGVRTELTTELGRIDATVSSRASQTSLDTLDNIIDTEFGDLVTAVADLPTNAELATALGTADDAVLSAIAALSIPTAADNADAVWDEALSGHVTAGTFGYTVTLAAVNITSALADTNELQTDWANGGRLEVRFDTLDTSVGDLPTNAELATAISTGLATYDGPTHAEMTSELATSDDAMLAAIAALNNLSSANVSTAVTTALTTAIAESYRATGSTGSVAQLLYEILGNLINFENAGTLRTVTKLDKSTTAKTYTYDDASAPTAVEETT